jgi:hypothetical protein
MSTLALYSALEVPPRAIWQKKKKKKERKDIQIGKKEVKFCV